MAMRFDHILKFLKDLKKNNNREWFEKNKPRFETAKADFESFVTDLLAEMIKFDESLAGLEPKKLIFRIYRDVRFSKDKSPYKKNMSAAMSSVGKGLMVPGYYFHIEPGSNSMLGVGLYMPQPENLAKVRQEIDYNGTSLTKIFKDRKFKSNFGDFWDEDKLKMVPKGYAKDHPHGEWLKLKSFIVTHSFTDKEVIDKKFLRNITGVAKSAKPLNDFLEEAIS
jgi:uncharacterized protein (TIGR02453 family)